MQSESEAKSPPRPLRISARQIVLLNALDEHRNLRRAAAAIHTTQPAATALLQQLEQALKVSLFERHSRGMRPTPYGEVMIRYARGVLHDYEHAEDEITALARGAAGLVRVGTVMGPMPTLLKRSVSRSRPPTPACGCRSSSTPATCSFRAWSGATSTWCSAACPISSRTAI